MRATAIHRVPNHLAAIASAALLASACATAGAAAIDGITPPQYRAPANAADAFEVDRIEERGPVLRVPRQATGDIDEVLRSLRVQRPRLEDNGRWFDSPPPQPVALQMDSLLQDIGADAWLSRHNDASKVAAGKHLTEVLRGLINVSRGEETLALSVAAPPSEPATPTGTGTGTGYGDALLRSVVASMVEPYRRSDGSVGFSILGFGEFYIEIERGMRNLRLIEESSGLSLRYRQPNPATPISANGDAGEDDPAGTVVYSDVRQVKTISADELRITSLLRSTIEWFQESLLVKIVALVWLLAMVVRGLVSLAEELRRRRRAAAHAAILHPAPATATGGMPTPPHARSQDASHARRTRRRRRRRSPTLHNLLKSLGLR